MYRFVEFFSFNPELADDGPIEDGDVAFDNYEREEDDGEAFEYKELDLEALASEAQEVIKQSALALQSSCDNNHLLLIIRLTVLEPLPSRIVRRKLVMQRCQKPKKMLSMLPLLMKIYSWMKT